MRKKRGEPVLGLLPFWTSMTPWRRSRRNLDERQPRLQGHVSPSAVVASISSSLSLRPVDDHSCLVLRYMGQYIKVKTDEGGFSLRTMLFFFLTCHSVFFATANFTSAHYADIDHFLSSHNRKRTTSFFCPRNTLLPLHMCLICLETKNPARAQVSDTFSEVSRSIFSSLNTTFLPLCVNVFVCVHLEFVPLSTLALTLAGATMITQRHSADASRSNSFPSKALDSGSSGFPVRASANNPARACDTSG